MRFLSNAPVRLLHLTFNCVRMFMTYTKSTGRQAGISALEGHAVGLLVSAYLTSWFIQEPSTDLSHCLVLLFTCIHVAWPPPTNGTSPPRTLMVPAPSLDKEVGDAMTKYR